MTTAYATSDAGGVEWRWRGTVPTGRAGLWDARGARATTVLPDGRTAYDGHRIYYEARLDDESHELRTELVPA